MPGFRVTIDDEVYEGSHPSQPDAVYAALIKQGYDKRERWLIRYKYVADGAVTREKYKASHEAYRDWSRSSKMIAVESAQLENKRKMHFVRKIAI